MNRRAAISNVALMPLLVAPLAAASDPQQAAIAGAKSKAALRNYLLEERYRLQTFQMFSYKPSDYNDHALMLKKVSQFEAGLEGFFKAAELTKDLCFHLGMISLVLADTFRALKQVDKEAHYRKIHRDCMQAAVQQLHPGAMEWHSHHSSKSRYKSKEWLEEMKRSVKHGAYSALGELSGAYQNWAGGGPLVTNFISENEALFHWMVMYFFLVRVDPQQRYFRLTLPENYFFSEPPLDENGNWREAVEKARAQAGELKADYFPEEMDLSRWRSFNFEERP